MRCPGPAMAISFQGWRVGNLCLSLFLFILLNIMNGSYKGTKPECCQDSDSLLGTIGIVRSQTQLPSSCPGCVQWGQTTSGQGVHVSVVCVRLKPNINSLLNIYLANICSLDNTFFSFFWRPGLQLSQLYNSCLNYVFWVISNEPGPNLHLEIFVVFVFKNVYILCLFHLGL